jgi:hypothetical protein
MKYPGHTYGGFVPAISERGMTLSKHAVVSFMAIGTCKFQRLEQVRGDNIVHHGRQGEHVHSMRTRGARVLLMSYKLSSSQRTIR